MVAAAPEKACQSIELLVGEQESGVQLPAGLRRLGLTLIVMGVAALALAMLEHLNRIRRMGQLGLPSTSHFPLSVAAATALLVIGIAILIALMGTWSG